MPSRSDWRSAGAPDEDANAAGCRSTPGRLNGLAAVDDHDQDKLTGRWTALPVARDPMLDAVDLHGAHHLCHTYTTWLEDAGILIRTRLKPPESVSAQSALVGTGVIC